MSTFREDIFGGTWLRKCAVAGFVFACFTFPVSGKASDHALSGYLHEFWGPEKGFPASTISSITQTTDGYLWIGTDKGLVRFDGLSFRLFEPASSGPFELGPVRTVLADAQGNLWVLLQNTRLLRYHDGVFELSRGEAEDGITSVSLGTDGQVILSSVALGPLGYDGKHDVYRIAGEAPRPEPDAVFDKRR